MSEHPSSRHAQEEQVYSYRAATLRIPYVVLSVWIAAMGAFSLWLWSSAEHDPPASDFLPLLAVFALLTGVGVLGIFSYRKRLEPIATSHAGFWIGPPHEGKSRFVPWEEIERIIVIREGRSTSTAIGKGGIFVSFRGGRTVIFEQIDKFESLCTDFETSAPADAIESREHAE